MCSITLGDLLPTVNLGHLLLNELVTLLTDLSDLLAGDTEVLDCGQNLLGYLGSGLVLGQSVRVVQRVVCQFGSAIEHYAIALRGASV